jgi:F420-dependent oxidoreductase-like protein
MKLGVHLPVTPPVSEDLIALAIAVEHAGFDSIWSSEAYGADAVSTLAWAAAHTERLRLGTAVMQIFARTPAATAMTAMSLNVLSGGRFNLGLGLSGPGVVEGWHGVPYSKPLQRTREYVEIIRAALARKSKLEHRGTVFEIPYSGTNATGAAAPLRSTLPASANVPVYLAATGPKNVALALEVADGLLPIFFSPARCDETYGPELAQRVSAGFDLAPTVSVALGADVTECRDRLRPHMALYFGGMGPRGRNFYNDLARRYGYEQAAERIQNLYLDGKRDDAAAAVPDELIDEVALVGPDARVRDQLAAWKESPVTTLIIESADIDCLRRIAEIRSSI